MNLQTIISNQPTPANIIGKLVGKQSYHVWLCNKCGRTDGRPSLDKYCKCGGRLSFVETDSDSRKYNF